MSWPATLVVLAVILTPVVLALVDMLGDRSHRGVDAPDAAATDLRRRQERLAERLRHVRRNS